MPETWVQSLGWEDPLENGKATTPVLWPEEFHGQRSLVGYSPYGYRVRHNWATNTDTPVFLPGKFHEQRSLVGYNPWGLKDLDMTERLTPPPHTHTLGWPKSLYIQMKGRRETNKHVIYHLLIKGSGGTVIMLIMMMVVKLVHVCMVRGHCSAKKTLGQILKSKPSAFRKRIQSANPQGGCTLARLN